MTSLKTSIKTITYLSDTGCLEIQGASLMRLFSSPGHIVVAGQSGGGKSVPVKELIDRIIQKYKEPFDE
ncbi:hypothetical protein GXG93_03135 [Shigella sonnei]|nr:hypothetical protein [Shigella sonnei]